MGTSVSQGSPRNTNWNRVMTCYKNENIPEDRVLKEVWRASDNQEIRLSNELKSEAIFSCYQAVQTSQNFQEALSKVNSSILEKGGNSISAEFAKRVIPLAFNSNQPSEAWKGLLVSEVTKYVVSRDASGFVGEKYRNKSVGDLIEFKKSLGEMARNTAASVNVPVKNFNDWKRFVDLTVTKLKSEK